MKTGPSIISWKEALRLGRERAAYRKERMQKIINEAMAKLPQKPKE
jgi:hypothetical protein